MQLNVYINNKQLLLFIAPPKHLKGIVKVFVSHNIYVYQ